MSFYHSKDKILSFRQPSPSSPSPPLRKGKKKIPLHPRVRRRRLIWLGAMVCFIAWTLIELVIQQNRIWNKQAILESQQQELTQVKQEQKQLQQTVQRLKDPNYLMELAHKHGYGKPGEKNIEVEKKQE